MSAEGEKSLLSAAIEREEADRAKYIAQHRHACVPWRGCGGLIGACIYCGKQLDALSLYYADRAASGMAALTARKV